MKSSLKLRFLAAVAIAFTAVNHLGIDVAATRFDQSWLQGDHAEAARSSGGRSRGGSFGSSSSSGSRSSGSSSSRSSGSSFNHSSGSSSSSRSSHSSFSYGSSGSNYSTTSGSSFDNTGFLRFMMILLLVGGSLAVGLIVYMILKELLTSQPSPLEEQDNDVVTVTKLQVALLAQARHVQTELTQLTLDADTDSSEGVAELMRESVLVLLRSPESWTHISTSSETVKTREQATEIFEQLSIAERSKFEAETLVNVGGRVRRQALNLDADEPAAYIVVTLLIGSAHDRPLINSPIHSAEELQAALQQLGSLSPEYLMVFELLWSPQDSADSLSYDEMVSNYPHLMPIA